MRERERERERKEIESEGEEKRVIEKHKRRSYNLSYLSLFYLPKHIHKRAND